MSLKKRLRPVVFQTLQKLRLVNYWLIAKGALALLTIIRLLPPDSALNGIDRLARRFGPLFGRHRTALGNLRLAYPEKSEPEIEAIALDMWGNMARLLAEYVFAEKLFDYDPARPDAGRVEVVGREIFERLRQEDAPHIFFTAHMGNFEFLPMAAATFGLDLTALFRAPNNPYLARELFSKREQTMGGLVASKAGAAFTLARILERGGNIGVLVDQKFQNGVRTTFFGRECETSPLLGKLARQYDCPVHPARCIRLPGNRYRMEVFEAIDLPRTPAGTVDVKATAQRLNDIVEGWVREEPGQWMWFHKRWRLYGQ